MRRTLGLLVLTACGAAAPAASSPPPPAASAPGEDVLPHESFTLDSKVLGEPRRINVYLPPGYAGGSSRHAILYMPDGGVGEDFPHVTRTVDELIRAGKLRAVIVVGIENTERRRDLTPPTEIEEDRQIAPRVGGSAAFRAFLRDELMAAMETRVRGSGERAIIGESLAGLFVIETLLVEPTLFDHYIALSPSLWWNDQALVRGAGEGLARLPLRPTTLYLAVAGDDDRGDAVARFAAAVEAAAARNLAFVFAPMPAEQHSTIYRAAAPLALQAVLE
jgi:predicted alpha/beta superfamily hydrolase